MPRLSIVVPLMGDQQRFEDTLVSVLENQPERSEVVVVTRGPYEDPYDLRREVGFVEAPLRAGLLECFAAGLGGSRAPLIHLLAAGVEATPGWADAALERFNCGDVAAVAPLVVDRQQPQKVLSAGLRYARSGSIKHLAAGRRLDRFKSAERLLCGPVLECSFYRREALASIVSLPNYPSARAAAVELGLAVIAAGYRCVQAPECLTTAYGEMLSHRGGWREGVAGERLFRRWAMLPDGKRSRLGHAVVVAMECVQSPLRPSLLGRLAGRCWAALGLSGTGEIALAAEAAAQQPGLLSCPSPYAAAQSRAA